MDPAQEALIACMKQTSLSWTNHDSDSSYSSEDQEDQEDYEQEDLEELEDQEKNMYEEEDSTAFEVKVSELEAALALEKAKTESLAAKLAKTERELNKSEHDTECALGAKAKAEAKSAQLRRKLVVAQRKLIVVGEEAHVAIMKTRRAEAALEAKEAETEQLRKEFAAIAAPVTELQAGIKALVPAPRSNRCTRRRRTSAGSAAATVPAAATAVEAARAAVDAEAEAVRQATKMRSAAEAAGMLLAERVYFLRRNGGGRGVNAGFVSALPLEADQSFTVTLDRGGAMSLTPEELDAWLNKLVGASFKAKSTKWECQMKVDGATARFGVFDTEVEAARERDTRVTSNLNWRP